MSQLLDDKTTSVVIDDQDNRIKYGDGWSAVSSMPNPNYPVGCACYHQTRMLADDKGTKTFSLDFSGSWVRLHGTMDNFESLTRPPNSINCTIQPSEGIKIPETPGGRDVYNGSYSDVLCGFDGLSPTTAYTLSVSAFGDIDMDYAQYGTQKPNVGDVVRFSHKSSLITYSENTTVTDEFGVLRQYGGINISFYGDSAIPYFYLSRKAADDSRIEAVYDFSPAPQPIKPVAGDEYAYYPLQVESSYPHTVGPHWLSIRYFPIDDSAFNPNVSLYFDFVEVQYEALPTTSSASPVIPTSNTSLPTPEENSTDVSTIIGATIGSILGLFIVLGFILLRSRQKKQRAQNLRINPFRGEEVVTPFVSGSNGEQKAGDDESRTGRPYGGIGQIRWAMKQVQELLSTRSERAPSYTEGPPSQRVIQVIHADSGVRIPQATEGEVVEEIPPTYTPR